MKQSTSNIPTESWPKILEEWQYKILSLELELRQGSYSSHIKEQEKLKERSQRIALLKEKIGEFKSLVADKLQGPSYDWHEMLPHVKRCSSLEKQVLLTYQKDLEKVLLDITKIDSDLIKKSQEVLSKGLGFFGLFKFSYLRKLLSAQENLHAYIAGKEKQTKDQLIHILRLAYSENPLTENQINLRFLLKLFEETGDILTRMQNHKSHIGAIEAQIRWKKQWLKKQELKLSEYLSKSASLHRL